MKLVVLVLHVVLLSLLGTGCGEDVRCVRAIACVESCGGPIVHEGCDCPSGTIAQESCPGDAGTH